MAGRFFILQEVADFAPGYFENTVVVGGCVCLAPKGRQYHNEGSYTSIPFHSEGFFSMIPSWNADTPPGTSVEMEARVSTGGKWSRWFSFGKWSPYMQRSTAGPQSDDVAQLNRESLSLADGCPAADTVQLRVRLFGNGGGTTPQVRMLAASTNATQQVMAEAPAFARQLEIPRYACLNRDPALSSRIAGATTLAMMMNRWGRDLLPEEVGRCAYDYGEVRYSNLNFLCAAAASYGFTCHMAYAGLSLLRREVWQGRAVAARVQYRAPSLAPAADAQPESGRPLPPVWEDAETDSSGHLVAVCGFAQRADGEFVVLHDPLAHTDHEVRKEVPLQVFAKIYTGLALFLQRGPRTPAAGRPQRAPARMQTENGSIRLFRAAPQGLPGDEEELAPARLLNGELSPATLCYTLADGTAYASAAQQTFYYTTLAGDCCQFDKTPDENQKLTVYLIGPLGESWVAEKLPPRHEKS